MKRNFLSSQNLRFKITQLTLRSEKVRMELGWNHPAYRQAGPAFGHPSEGGES